MASLSHLTAANVTATLERIDTEGEAAFLEATGYGASKLYRILANGRSYPSKAVVGVAADLAPADLFGGVAQVVPALQRLGFEVARAGRRVASVGLESLARHLELPTRELPALPVEPAAVFASGSNRPGEIRGMAAVGVDVGVAAPEINPEAEAALAALAGTDVMVFVDSGAFSEVVFGAAGPQVVDPITPARWESVLELYARLGSALGSQLAVVAPDRVGCQETTLERLTRYAPEMRALHALGVRVLVPIQMGQLSAAAFAAAADQALGFTGWTPALPSAKADAGPDQITAFLEARNPSHVHLLGIGPLARNVAAYLAPFAGTRTSVSLDACWITGNVGRTNGRHVDPAETKGGPRRYTLARDLSKAALGATATAARVAELALLVALGSAIL